MKELVAVKVVDSVEVHFPDSSGNYATVCGLDGADDNFAVEQSLVELPKNAKVNCSACINIFDLCREYSEKSIERKAKEVEQMDKLKKRVIEILFDNEEHMTDGFSYYCGDAEKFIDGLAETIIEACLEILNIEEAKGVEK